ncbi:hypothetical protein GLW07_06350 [Bacillus hwajinpoensis]|uniref:Peptidase M48 domain-containing protein n=1 Tax=Guptibacillus hwajinpoensis TaxID=208199 RepID=A0A845EWR0_9BACL|nr:hypothetical protein [Pseudalkalibacillus hwajinpoensis]MYL62977.1 hypothetical protein [Pseudalkalibacillus hwajinpoensis]
MKDYSGVLHSIVRRLQKQASMNVPIQLTDYFPGERLIGGKYSLETNMITIYMEEVRKQCILLFGSEDHLNDYFTVIVAHELGHAADKSLVLLAKERSSTRCVNKKRQLSIIIEDNAWKFAMKLIPELSHILVTVRNQSMDLYGEREIIQ